MVLCFYGFITSTKEAFVCLSDWLWIGYLKKLGMDFYELAQEKTD